MRYYEITLTPTAASLSAQGGVSQQGQIWTSQIDGKFNPGAWNVQLDLLTGTYASPLGNSTISIDGPALSDLFQSQKFAGMNITVKGGMQKGLPLAKPQQAGLLLQGSVYQSWANWIGTDMNLNFVVIPSIYSYQQPGNLIVNWQKGQSLQDALSTCFQTAYPALPAAIFKIGSYSNTQTLTHAAHNLTQLSQWLQSVTQSQTSTGVNVSQLPNGTILVWDGSIATSKVAIDFLDLIGQPKWVNPLTMQFTTVMRSDIQIGTWVTMPKGLPYAPGTTTTYGSSLPSLNKYKTTFQGEFIIQSVRHVGNSRDPDGTSWVTIFQAVANGAG